MQIVHDKRLLKIVSGIQEKYKCHTVILYGSHARHEHTKNSDYDIIAVRKKGKMERDCRFFAGTYLDIFIYSENEIKNPEFPFLSIRDGIVVCQKNNFGNNLLKKAKKIFDKGPKRIKNWEKQVIEVWSNKMLDRVRGGGVEGDFRRHVLLIDLLESYFYLRNRWYLGPNESFQWLKIHDHGVYLLFKEALKANAVIKTLEKLVAKVIKK
jgi:predicted nucleotidyltransferase